MSVDDGLIDRFGPTYLTTADRIVAIFAAIKTIKLARTILISCKIATGKFYHLRMETTLKSLISGVKTRFE